MKTSGKIIAALAASFALFGAFPGYDVPFRAVAHAEGEIAPPSVETDLGTPLPLFVHSQTYSEEGWNWQTRWSGITLQADGAEWIPLGAALSAYGEAEAAEAAEGSRTVKSLYVHRADSLAVSFAESCAAYGGGMRGRYAVFGRNYDAATGAALTMDDVFANVNILANEIAILLNRNYPDAPFYSHDHAALADIVRQNLGQGADYWTLDPSGATFYFPPGVLAADPYGPIYTATVLFNFPGIFQEKYCRAPEQWCMEIEPNTPMRAFLADSILNTIEVKGDADGIHIIRGGAAATGSDGIREKTETVFTDPLRSNGIRPVLVKMRDGRKYLYVDILVAPAPEDYEKGYDAQTMMELENKHELRVYDLTGGDVRRVDCDSRFTMRNEWLRDESAPKEWFVMTDPENFLLNVTGVPLRDAHRRCRVGANGAPEIIEAIQ